MYAKVFSQIFDSSIADDYLLRHFFTDLLILADSDGVVDMTPNAIAARTRIPIEKVMTYLTQLESPDPESRTPDHDGRRIAKLDDHRSWGWQIVNYQKFRDIATEDQRRTKTRERVKKFRGKTPCNADVTPCNASNAMHMQKHMQKHIQKDIAASPPVFTNGEHAAFIKGWCDNFRVFHGFDYVVQSGRDGKAVKELLSQGILRLDLLEFAKEAWARARKESKTFWHCSNACTIHGFKHHLNEIRVELDRPISGNPGSNGNTNVSSLVESELRKLDKL